MRKCDRNSPADVKVSAEGRKKVLQVPEQKFSCMEVHSGADILSAACEGGHHVAAGGCAWKEIAWPMESLPWSRSRQEL